MRPAARFAAALVLAASLLPSNPAGAAPRIEEIPDAVTALLDDYGGAFADHDRSRLAGTLHPGAFADAELASLDNAAGVPFSRFVVRATTQFSGDLASPRVRARYPELEVRTYHVVLETAFDIERTPDMADGVFTFVREGPDGADPYDGWRLASDADLEILGFYSPRYLWDEGVTSVLRSEHFLLLTHPDAVDEMRPVLVVAERAYARATRFWPRPVEDRYAIVVPTSTAELDRLIRATVDLSKFVAFVAAGVDRQEGWEPTGARLYVHLDHLRNYGAPAQEEIVAHELIHAVTRPVSGPNVPVWVEEGLANTGGGSGGRASLARSGPVPEEFPSDELFVTGPVRDIQRRYDLAQVAIQVLIDEKGIEGLARFYEALGRARVVAGTHRYHVNRAATEAVGWSVDEWTAVWRKGLG